MRTLTFQIGVDVLGFPIYCIHRISEHTSKCGTPYTQYKTEIVKQR